jgi:hypothetical protein
MRLAKMLQAKAPTRGTEVVDVPPSFLGFLGWLGVTPSAGQAELARVAFDGTEPVDRDIAAEIFGDLDFAHLPMGARRVVAAVVGGRGGKTYLLIALRLVHGMLVRDLSPLAPGEEAFATVVAPNDNLRQQAINFALGACRSKPELRALLRLPKGAKPDSVVSEFGLYRADADRVVTFLGAVATRGGYDVRGKWHTDLALDECAFFRDATAKVNDKDIYEAGIARVLPGGQCILGSTPWAKAGLLWEFYRDNYGKPSTALVAHAPTLRLSDIAATRELVEIEFKRNPENAKREYGAQFMETGTTVFFESTTLDAAVTDEPFAPRPGDIIAAGGDFGFRSDSSALLVVALRGKMVHVFDGEELRPNDAPLKPSATVAAFAKLIAGRCSYLMADQHYREAIAEHLETHGLAYAPAPLTPADTYVRARMLLREGRVRLHGLEFRDRLVQQMREVHGKPTSGGGMSIVHPRWATGGHGDLCAALVLALWQVSGDEVPIPKADVGTDEWVAQQREARQARMVERRNSPTDRGRGAFWKRAG